MVGAELGEFEITFDGRSDGLGDGTSLLITVGLLDGEELGIVEGANDGDALGFVDGFELGLPAGW